MFSSLSQMSHDRLERLQRHAGRVCLGLPLFEPTNRSSLLHHTSLPTLSSRRQYRQLVFAHALVHGRVPHHLRNTSRPDFAQRSHHDLRRQRTYAIPTTRTTRHRDSPVNNAAHHYNNLPQDLTAIVDALTFRQAIAPLIYLFIYLFICGFPKGWCTYTLIYRLVFCTPRSPLILFPENTVTKLNPFITHIMILAAF